MSRLIDRIRAYGCKPLRLSLINAGGPTIDETLKDHFLDQASKSDKITSSYEIERLVASARANYSRNEPVSTEIIGSHEFDNVPVFAADDVALYINTLPLGTNISDVVSSMAPPFDKFFIEFQNVSNQRTDDKLYAWGTLITVNNDPEGNEIDGKPRWILHFKTFLERERGKPFGPVARHFAALADDGTWFRHADGALWWGGGIVDIKGVDKEPPPPEIHKEYGDYIAQLLFPALLTISFLHCKNIDIKPIDPPDKLSRNFFKKHGTKLTRYHVLEISPMKRLLEQVRSGEKTDLRRALHICRGHFKTFTNDAPLFGRYTGKYWWPSQVRGAKESGLSVKDYRVTAPSDIGKAYQEADERPLNIERNAPPSKDPDSLGRGLAAHNKTQNFIAQVVSKLGWLPRSPISGEPEFDVAWKAKDTLYVCEVKSLSSSNEERQLRLAIGQVIRYRQKLNSLGHEPVMAVLATEVQPTDTSWADLCDSENIVLIWPEIAVDRLKAANEKTMV